MDRTVKRADDSQAFREAHLAASLYVPDGPGQRGGYADQVSAVSIEGRFLVVLEDGWMIGMIERKCCPSVALCGSRTVQTA